MVLIFPPFLKWLWYVRYVWLWVLIWWYVCIQGESFKLTQRNISRTTRFRKNYFKQKLFGFAGQTKQHYSILIRWTFQGHVKVNLVLSNWNLYIFFITASYSTKKKKQITSLGNIFYPTSILQDNKQNN